MEFYRIYHIDAKGGTAALTNFRAADDARACEQATILMAQSEWPGIELWEGARQIHCHGVERLTNGLPEFPVRKAAAVTLQ